MEYIRKIEEIKNILNSEKVLDTRSSRVLIDKITEITFPKDYIQYVSDINIDNVIYNEGDFIELIHNLTTNSLFVQGCGKEVADRINQCKDEEDFYEIPIVLIHKVLEFVTSQVSKKKMIYPTVRIANTSNILNYEEDEEEEKTNFEKGKVRVADYVLLKDTLQTILIKLMMSKLS
jgi:hypothetical protein